MSTLELKSDSLLPHPHVLGNGGITRFAKKLEAYGLPDDHHDAHSLEKLYLTALPSIGRLDSSNFVTWEGVWDSHHRVEQESGSQKKMSIRTWSRDQSH